MRINFFIKKNGWGIELENYGRVKLEGVCEQHLKDFFKKYFFLTLGLTM